MDKRLLIKLAKARKDVREKLRGLTSEIASSQEMFETRFRPLTEPIKNLISEIKQEKPLATSATPLRGWTAVPSDNSRAAPTNGTEQR
jgi:hypothetical protein